MGNVIRHWDIFSSPEVRPHETLFRALQFDFLSLGRLMDLFNLVDKDRSGRIDLDELFAYLDVEKSVFRQRVFKMFDEDESQDIDFKEFVIALWNYCTLSRHTLELFAFDLYDSDANGELSAKEIEMMLHDLYGAEAKTNENAIYISHDLNNLSTTHLFTITRFHEYVHTRPSLLFPAFSLQSQLRQRVLGERFWERITDRRIRLNSHTKGFITIASVMRMNVSSDNLQMRTQGSHADISSSDKAVLALLRYTGTLHYRQQERLREQTVYEEEEKKRLRKDRLLGRETAGSEEQTSRVSERSALVEKRFQPLMIGRKEPEWDPQSKFSSEFASKEEQHERETVGALVHLHARVSASTKTSYLTTPHTHHDTTYLTKRVIAASRRARAGNSVAPGSVSAERVPGGKDSKDREELETVKLRETRRKSH